ncbi:MAG: cysteine-rich CWC family protein [Polaromonas sp.]|nr:cysteine-rich CWC family protein [Polaromonas sp.]
MTTLTAPSSTPPAANSVCAACGTAFRCGMVSADATCWCFNLPHVMAVPPVGVASEKGDDASCLCPTCLHQKLEEKHHGDQP